MTQRRAIEDFSPTELDRIAEHASQTTYPAGTLIFSEGDAPDFIYFIRSGWVSVNIKKFTVNEELAVLGAGQCFGEMAVLDRARRSASVKALTETTVLALDSTALHRLQKIDSEFCRKIRTIFALRSDELSLRENLIETSGVPGRHLYISIKGDPSLRETAFERGRYESIVDRVLPQIVPNLTELLLERCAFQVQIHFNSGEINVTSVLDPFNDEIHPADKLADPGYIDRHFSRLSYEDKAGMIQRQYDAIAADPCYGSLLDGLAPQSVDSHKDWHPMTPEKIRTVIERLPDLRRIPNFYLRNFKLSMTRDAVRMQFNCDGTHIVGAEDYLKFIEDNLGIGERAEETA